MNKKTAVGAIMVIVGMILFVLVSGDIFGLLFKRVKIEETKFDSFEEGDFAEDDLKFILDKAGEISGKKKIFGIPMISTDYSLYLITDNGGYVIIQAERDLVEFDRIVEQTKQYMEKSGAVPEPASFIGKACEIDDDVMSMISDYFSRKGVDAEVWQNCTSLYVLVQSDKDIIIIEFCICAALFIIGIILLIIGRRDTFGETVYVGEEPPAGPASADDADSTEESSAAAKKTDQ